MTAPHRLITTPIFYVNAAPHLGHLSSMVLADTAHRFAKLRGFPSILSTGTDEHGMKVARAAARANVPPQQFVDKLSVQFKKLAERANIDFCRFIRTTDTDHAKTAKTLWEKLQAAGMLYRAKHAGWYCVSDECFYPEHDIVEVDGQLVSAESGSAVEWYEEENWFFKLGEMQEKLINLFETQADFVVPKQRHEALLAELRSEKLPDLSVSRPASRCDWGIPVPGYPQDTMYVWFEALANYLTVATSQSPSNSLSEWWPATHIIGKDIIRFHAVYWPAFLLAAGLQPPRQVAVHSHWLMGGTKMSKSKQNVVDPFEMILKFGADSVRYALCCDGSLAHDSPFSLERIAERHNVNLVNKWANLAMRACGPRFSIQRSLAVLREDNEECLKLANAVNELRKTCVANAALFEFGKYARALNNFAINANTNLEAAQPWRNPDSHESHIAIAVAAETCRILSILLLPIIPEYASRMLDRLEVSNNRRLFEHAVVGADWEYGLGANRKGEHVLQRI